MSEEMDDNGQKKTKPPPPQRVAGSYPSFQPPTGGTRRLATGVPGHHGVTSLPPCPMIAESGTSARVKLTRSRGWKQPCLQPRLEIPIICSSGGGWKTRFISPWQDGILLPFQPGVQRDAWL